jgi:hypothetical protein
VVRATESGLPIRLDRLAPDRDLGWDAVPSVESLGGSGARVLFLGDSFTQSAAWPRETVARLRARGVAVEGWNLGVGGHGTIQTALKLERHAATYRPDLLLLLFFAWNDVRDNFDCPAILYGPGTARRPYVREDGGLARPWPWPGWVVTSRLFVRLVDARAERHGFERLAAEGVHALTARRECVLGQYGDPALWGPFYRPVEADAPYVRAAWAATERALARLRDTATAHRARLLILGLDNAFTVEADVFARWVPAPAGFDADLPLARLAALCARLGIPYRSTVPALRASRATGPRVYGGGAEDLSAHLTAAGERVVATVATEAVAAGVPRR